MGTRLLSLAEQLDDATLGRVFTHTSWASERVDSYERLEFLGDSVLSLAVTTELYRRFPTYTEGHLARLRAYVVSRATCAKVAAKLGLGKMLRERAGGVAESEAAQLMANTNVLADLTEALIGALYITFGYEAVRPAVVAAFAEHIDYAEESYVDHKTELQEYAARLGGNVNYRLVATLGPPHHREFEIEAVIDGEALGRGLGTSKKRAEQEAAAEALAELRDRARRSARRARLRSRRPGRTGVAASGAGSEGTEREAPVAGGRRRAAAKAPRTAVATEASGSAAEPSGATAEASQSAATRSGRTAKAAESAARPSGPKPKAVKGAAQADEGASPVEAEGGRRPAGGRARRRSSGRRAEAPAGDVARDRETPRSA